MSSFLIKNITLRPNLLFGAFQSVEGRIKSNQLKKVLPCRTYAEDAYSQTRKAARQEINDIYSTILSNNLNEVAKKYPRVSKQEIEWFQEVVDYNLHQGRFFASGFLFSYLGCEQPERLTEKNIELANICAICMEMIVAKYTVMDDIIDQSQQRNKRKSWYTIENVGLSAVYDLCIIKEVACLLLKQHLINSNMYKHFQKQIHNGTLKVHLAEVIDRIHKPSTFTIELYDIVALYKSTNVLWAIIALAVHLAGITDVNSMKQMEKVCVKIGRLYQRENDYHDCYQTTRTGKDIEKGQISWLYLTAFQKANDEQKRLLLNSYGKPGAESLETVTGIYRDLDMGGEWIRHVNMEVQEIQELIDQLSERSPKQAYNVALHKFLSNYLNVNEET